MAAGVTVSRVGVVVIITLATAVLSVCCCASGTRGIQVKSQSHWTALLRSLPAVSSDSRSSAIKVAVAVAAAANIDDRRQIPNGESVSRCGGTADAAGTAGVSRGVVSLPVLDEAPPNHRRKVVSVVVAALSRAGLVARDLLLERTQFSDVNMLMGTKQQNYVRCT